MRAPKEKLEPMYHVSILPPAPNPMFTAFQHDTTRFLHFTKPVKCAHCGKAKKRHWTSLRFFRVMDLGAFTLIPSRKEYAPLTPVCEDHILNSPLPGMPDDAKPKDEKPPTQVF